jgi:hypothetical protein
MDLALAIVPGISMRDAARMVNVLGRSLAQPAML